MNPNINGNKKKRTGVIVLWVCIVLALLGGSIGYWQYTVRSQKNTTVNVVSFNKVEKGEVRSFFDATGIIKAENGAVVTISSRISGTVTKVLVRTGETVKANQIILVLDTKDIALAVKEGEANLAKAQAQLRSIQQVYPSQIEDAKQAIIVAEGEYNLALTGKTKAIADNKSMSKLEQDTLNQKVLIAKNGVDRAKSIRSRLVTEMKLAEQTAQASVAQAEAQVALSKNQLAYSTVRSPLSATVSTVFVRAGEQVLASKPLATMIDTNRLEMVVYIDESDIGLISKSAPVEFTVDALPQTVFNGVVAQVYPEPEIRDGVVYYKAIVPIAKAEAKKLYSEMTTQVQVITKVEKNVIRVPNSALKWVGSKRVLYVKQGNTFVEVTPELGIAGSKFTQVLKGVNEGDIIATEIRMNS